MAYASSECAPIVLARTPNHAMSQELIPVFLIEGLSFPFKLGFHSLNPHLGISWILIVYCSEVVAVLVAEVQQGLTERWAASASSINNMLLLYHSAYMKFQSERVLVRSPSLARPGGISCGQCW